MANEHRMTRMALTAMVAGGMVGAGSFSLPRTFANATGPLGAVIAWLIAGTGMYTLARVFQSLAERRPDLDAGVLAYAKAGFGDYPGHLSAFGYWIGSCIGSARPSPGSRPSTCARPTMTYTITAPSTAGTRIALPMCSTHPKISSSREP